MRMLVAALQSQIDAAPASLGAERLAKSIDRLVDCESGTIGRDLEEHASGSRK